MERQLAGKWGMFLAESDMNTSPQRVMEWLPVGKWDNYAPGFERSLPQPDLWQNWYVRDGMLISRYSTTEPRKINESRDRLEWINSDNFRRTIEGIEANPATIYYRRFDAGSDTILNTELLP